MRETQPECADGEQCKGFLKIDSDECGTIVRRPLSTHSYDKDEFGVVSFWTTCDNESANCELEQERIEPLTWLQVEGGPYCPDYGFELDPEMNHDRLIVSMGSCHYLEDCTEAGTFDIFTF